MALISFIPHIPHMPRIIIDHFGPIEHLDLEIKDLTILIGPNASGKSLVGKLVWFFRSIPKLIRDDAEVFGKDLDSERERGHFPDSPGYLKHLCEQVLPLRFLEYFPAQVYGQQDSKIVFGYAINNDQPPFSITLEKDAQQRWVFTCSEALVNGLQAFQARLSESLKSFTDSKDSLNEPYSPYQQNLWQWVDQGFGMMDWQRNPHAFHYITASRNNLYELALQRFESPRSGKQDREDPFTRDFVNFFFRSVLSQSEIESYLSHLQIRAEESSSLTDKLGKLEKYLVLMSDLIGGRYQLEGPINETIAIHTDQGEKSIPIKYATSGQQNSSRLLASLLPLMKMSFSSLCVIEEPEMNLYPTAQQQVVSAIALFLSIRNGNQLIINTHSPYVLSAFDNLITAAQVAKERPNQTDRIKEVVPQEMWIEFERVSAIYLDEGSGSAILNHERGGLGGNKIDDASDEVADTFDQLLEIRYAPQEEEV